MQLSDRLSTWGLARRIIFAMGTDVVVEARWVASTAALPCMYQVSVSDPGMCFVSVSSKKASKKESKETGFVDDEHRFFAEGLQTSAQVLFCSLFSLAQPSL